MTFKYLIFDTKRKTYLDKNLYYVTQNGIFYKISSPLPIRLEEQERYEVRLILDGGKNETINKQ